MKYLRAAAPYLVSAAILFYVFSQHSLVAVMQALTDAQHTQYLLLLSLFLVVMLWLDGLYLYAGTRWIARVGRFGELLRARAAASLLVIVHMVAGLGALTVYLKRRYGVSYARGMQVMGNELLHDVGAMGTLALVAALFAPIVSVPAASLPYLLAAKWIGLACVIIWATCFAIGRYWKKAPVISGIAARYYLGLYLLKLGKCVVFALFVLGALVCFDVRPPLLVGVALVQLALLAHGLPISAFGLGIDQVTFPILLAAWEPSSGRILAFSLVYTTSLACGRSLLGLPFVRGVSRDMREPP